MAYVKKKPMKKGGGKDPKKGQKIAMRGKP